MNSTMWSHLEWVCFLKLSWSCISVNLLIANGERLKWETIFLLVVMIVFTACWENNESFIESCNVCMKYDSDCKPHSLTLSTIFAPESLKTKKTLLEILYSSRTLCNSSLNLAPVCVPGNGTTLRVRKGALFALAVQMSVVKEMLVISSRND